jgi:hypothetical protein
MTTVNDIITHLQNMVTPNRLFIHCQVVVLTLACKEWIHAEASLSRETWIFLTLYALMIDYGFTLVTFVFHTRVRLFFTSFCLFLSFCYLAFPTRHTNTKYAANVSGLIALINIISFVFNRITNQVVTTGRAD